MYMYTPKRHNLTFAVFSKPRNLVVDSAGGLFSSNGKNIALFDIKPAKISIIPLIPNPDKLTLYRVGGKSGLHIFVYRDNQDRLFISSGSNFISIHRDEIPGLRQGIRRYTRMPFITPRKRPSGVDYECPKDYP